jgi:hypothetical protein
VLARRLLIRLVLARRLLIRLALIRLASVWCGLAPPLVSAGSLAR